MTTTETGAGIPVRTVSRAEMIEELQSEISEYERRYEMPSARMVAMVEQDAIKPSVEVIKWYQSYDVLQSLLTMTPTTGIHGTITKMSTTAG